MVVYFIEISKIIIDFLPEPGQPEYFISRGKGVGNL
jgi:hypothetical protein